MTLRARFARKVDANQIAVVAALRAAGVKVEPRLARVGGGVGDLLCGYRGRLSILEVKDGRLPPSRRRLTPEEQSWHQEWAGYPVFAVESPEEAVRLVTQRAAPEFGSLHEEDLGDQREGDTIGVVHLTEPRDATPGEDDP